MARSAEKNDVDISQLWRWSKKVVLDDTLGKKKVEIHIRIVGDVDLNRAKVYGYRQANKLRKSLKEQDSESRVSFIAELEEFEDKDLIIKTIVLLESPELYREAVADVQTEVLEPVEPKSTAPQEKWEDYQNKVDSFEDSFRQAIEDKLEELQEKEEKNLSGLTEKELHELYQRLVTNRLCEEEFQNSFYDMCVFYGTYLDKEFTKKAFNDFDSYDNSHPTLKNTLRMEYRDLEVGFDLLKKLPEATE
jgi:hypothetical protein